MAVREAGLTAVALRLRKIGNAGLAEAFEEAGPERLAAIDRLEEQLRGLWAIDAYISELIDAAENVVKVWRSEVERECDHLLCAAADALGRSGERGLPSARALRARSAIHPRLRARWYDRLGSLKATRACYQYWRNTMGDTLSPAVDEFKDHILGPR